VAVAGLLIAAGACSDGDSGTVAPGTTTTPTAAASSTTRATTATTAGSVTTTDPTATTPSTTPAIVLPGEVVLRGTVSTVFLSARVLGFDPPVDGYARVALTTETEYVEADGSPAMLVDLVEGSVVEVTGTPGSGSPEALIARRVVILG
jgi:hypothetical protein